MVSTRVGYLKEFRLVFMSKVRTFDRVHTQGTFTRLVHAHAGRTQLDAPDRLTVLLTPAGDLNIGQLDASLSFSEVKPWLTPTRRFKNYF